MTDRATIRRAFSALALVLALVAAPTAAQAQDGSSNTPALAAGSVLCSLLYTPIKVVYAVGGGLVTGLAYAFSAGDRDVVDPIVRASMGGDYFVTPSILRGDRPLRFTGL